VRLKLVSMRVDVLFSLVVVVEVVEEFDANAADALK
jgi:hypothetical protein